MTTKHQSTPEQEGFKRLVKDWETLSEAACTVFSEAERTALAAFMVNTNCFPWPIEYEEALVKMNSAAGEITERDHELLARHWHAALAAAASIDADDYETLVGHRVYRGNLHAYYRMLSRMIEKTLREKQLAEWDAQLRKELAARDPEDLSDFPF